MTVWLVLKYNEDLYGRLYYDKIIGAYSTQDLAKMALPKTAKKRTPTGYYETQHGAYEILKRQVV